MPVKRNSKAKLSDGRTGKGNSDSLTAGTSSTVLGKEVNVDDGSAADGVAAEDALWKTPNGRLCTSKNDSLTA